MPKYSYLFLFLSALVVCLHPAISRASAYYWVGGTGNWSDLRHWSTISGGTAHPNTIPDVFDDVYFDQNSFTASNQTVTISVSNTVCRNMDWTNALYFPTFAGSYQLRICGSLALTANMNWSVYGTLNFEATEPGKTILTAGKSMYAVTFNGSGGSWTLLDALNVAYGISLTAGTFNTNNMTINCQYISSTGSSRTLNLGSSVVNCNALNSTYAFYINTGFLTFNAGNSTIRVSGKPIISGQGILTITGTNPVIFNNIEITNLSSSCLTDNDYFAEIRPNTTIRKLVLAGRQVHLKSQYYFPRLTIDSLLINGSCIKTIDAGYELKINELVSAENPSLVLGTDPADTIRYLTFSGQSCTLNGNNSRFHKVSLYCDSYINGNNFFDSLFLAPSYYYEPASSSVQTIIHDLSVTGNCNGTIFIGSSIPGLPATFSKADGNINASYLVLRDINASGGAVFMATNSINLGNNTGWTFTNSLLPRTLYWTGNGGNWNDTGHWSLTSGGFGGACIPTPIDDVFFDQNSFSDVNQSIVVNISTPVCKNMSWASPLNSSAITGDSTRNLRIFGSLMLAMGMNWNFRGITYFDANTMGNTITSAGKQFLNNIDFHGQGGGWSLSDNLSTANNLVLSHGTLNTMGKTVSCKTFLSNSDNQRHLILGNSTIVCTSPAKDINLNINTDNFLMDAGTSTFRLSGKNSNDYPAVITGASPLVFYNVENSNTNDCGETNYTCWDFQTNVTMHKLTLLNRQFRMIKSSQANSVNIAIDSLVIKGDCEKVFDTLYKFDIEEIVCSDNSLLILNADAQDQIRNILFNGLRCTINGNNAVFHKVVLNRDSYLNGNNTFDTLSFAPGYVYNLSSGNNQTILDHFSAAGTCTGTIILKSTNTGLQANIIKQSGTVHVNYGILQDLNAAGGATFSATNSIDMGNNTGWMISTGTSVNYFWVGGSGNWTDPAHWSLISGGPGNSCIPSPSDDVFFDANSFSGTNQTVTVNGSNAFCHSMTWSTSASFNPTFAGQSSSILRIYGSLTLCPGMKWTFPGVVRFESSTGGNSIAMTGKSFTNDVVFQGTYNGGWMLADSLKTSGTLFFNYGNLNTNGQKVYCRIFDSNNSNLRTLTLGNSIVNCNSLSSTVENFRLNSDNLTFNAGTSTFKITGNNIQTYPILINGSAPLVFYNMDVRNYGSSTLWDIRTRMKIQKLSVLCGSFSVVNNGSALKKLTLDTLMINSSSTIGTNAFLDTYSRKFEMKIREIICAGKTSLTLYCDPEDTIRNIRSDGVRCSLYGTGTRFHHVVYNCDANFYCSNSFDSLWFSPGHFYNMGAFYTQTIVDHLSALGNGCYPITIRSTSAGSQSIFSKASGNVVCGYLELRDQKATGGASFFAGKLSTNAGNNTGWNFTDGPGYIYGLGPDTSFCQGDTLTISTQYFYGGSYYLWQDGSTLPYFKATQPGQYWVEVTYANGCMFKDTIMAVQKARPPADASALSPICEGETLSLNGTGGTSCQWIGPGGYTSALYNPVIPGAIPAQSGNYILTTFQNGCSSRDTAVVDVLPSAAVAVAAVASANPVCNGTRVTFTASQTNGGTQPHYQWKVNDIEAGTDSNAYSYLPANGDVVQCILNSNVACSTGNPAGSNVITMTVNPVDSVSVSVIASRNPVCPDVPVTFTALPQNGGSVPVYQWRVNNIAAGANQPGFTYLPADGDSVTCVLISSDPCMLNNPSGSDPVIMTINPELPVSISITATDTAVCDGEAVSFSAAAVNAGFHPAYQWKVNGSDIALATSSMYSYIPGDGDVVRCEITSDVVCAINNPALSNSITVSVHPRVPVSVAISSSDNPVCEGTPVTFSASPLNGGSQPSYQWMVNSLGAGADSSSYVYVPAQGDIVQCMLTSNEVCPMGNPAASNTLTMIVKTYLPVGVAVTASANPVCEGNPVTLTALPQNGGNAPLFNWTVNGNNVAGTPSNGLVAFYPFNGNAADESGNGIHCTVHGASLTSDRFGNPARAYFFDGSASFLDAEADLLPTGERTVSIWFNAHSLTGHPVPISYGGLNCGASWIQALSHCSGSTLYNAAHCDAYSFDVPGVVLQTGQWYHWVITNDGSGRSMYLNGVQVATHSGFINNTFVAGRDLSIGVCVDTSGFAPYADSCTGWFSGIIDDIRIFNRTLSPAEILRLYHSESTFTLVPFHGDQIVCQLLSDELCKTGNPAVSTPVVMTVEPQVTTGVSITASPNPYCIGENVTLTATPLINGLNPNYLWQINGNNAGPDTAVFSYMPTQNDQIRCLLFTNYGCPTLNPAISDTIHLIAKLSPEAVFNPCFDTMITTGSIPFPLKGGLPPGGEYAGAGITPGSGIFNPAEAGTGNHEVSYIYTNAAQCSDSRTVTIHVQSPPPFSCGSDFTDIRDGQIYPTVQIGAQCWMAANLNYGTLIPMTGPQLDNCIPEKYCPEDLPGNCSAGAVYYQWDELMDYYSQPGPHKGLCPAGWHIPTEPEWNALFDGFDGKGRSGKPLKNDGPPGFNALLTGFAYSNHLFSMTGNATMFWTSSSAPDGKVWAHGLHQKHQSVSDYATSRNNAFAIRCLHD